MIKCYHCDSKFKYENLRYVLRIPEQMKYAPVCNNCRDKNPNTMPANLIRTYKFDRDKLKKENLLQLP